ncbi:flagellar basal-body rod protein FlgF [Trinickia caryophylli]|uniref:Flagellar basal-body rod protein FlgF n=1 Tax=Trinickia caryophylli TaxID=28094 RepID=A0A1X7FGM1_TRICW|nr:flagellar basal-body rod protein FlgF [Trinickia caryophylli]PMS13270.1 flagellar basal-body rod protein FlgF [Trinickia caryophylli]TRX19205.1 flagellar basal-body rod protein FlgF [Trinickia caryophylli]WQE13496.1 flagellar basal-body rod protein FlgF [Trinickia caryophylli]SMF51761.1 flagellar basal-body rod protein FlgF [Trinickia caryophylli]GLU33973.1 flagellar basal-body rod protein FlgF [Trinickia caryophylli]
MDRLIYTAMTGASQALEQQSVVANNLANVSTTGFRAQLAAYRAVPMNFGDGTNINPDTPRTFVLSSTPGADYAPGAISQTGNPLDVALQGAGWLTVQTADGNEAYTRAGNLHVDQNGQLVTAGNLPVIGNGGPIAVPPGAEVSIGKDGTISALTPGDPPTAVAVLDQLKLVNPAPASLTRGDDGLFRTSDGQPADADPTVTVTSGALESSNVNAVSAMVAMITNARQFQMQTKLLQTADQNEQSANQLLNFS